MLVPLLAKKRVQSRTSHRSKTAEAAHDFRNILNVVCMLSELAQRHVSNTLPANTLLQQIKEACADGNALCERMMDETSSEPTGITRVDLATLVMAMSSLLSAYLPGDCQLKFDPIEESPVYVAAEDIRRLLLNVVKNASEAIGNRPGVITISTGITEYAAVEPGSLLKGAETNGCYSYLSVSDTGCGMDETIRASLFEKRVTTKEDGHGLGLSSVKSIVRRYGGGLRVRSRVGCGTQVLVVLPCAT